MYVNDHVISLGVHLLLISAHLFSDCLFKTKSGIQATSRWPQRYLSFIFSISTCYQEQNPQWPGVCVQPENKSQNVPRLISQHPVQSVGGIATLSLSQSLHLHIVLTQPLTGRHLSESAANTMCEKNKDGINSFPFLSATCWLSFCSLQALGKDGAKQQVLELEDAEPETASQGG